MSNEKIKKLSLSLQKKIISGDQPLKISKGSPVTNFLVATKKHCNGGKTVDAGLWLREHVENGGKVFLSMAGAGSSFQMGILIGDLIRNNMLHGISVTGANMEESLYRYVAHSHYAYIPDYMELTPAEEEELRVAGLRRITDTFLPEDESVRKVLPALEKLWREADKNGENLLWHEFFFRLFDRDLVEKDDFAREEDCWLREAWRHKIPVIVPGREDSTMGNIFSSLCYNGNHPFLSKYKIEGGPIDPRVIKAPDAYMHNMAEWYMDTTKESSIAFLQLGGGISADFPICVVPHIKHDYLDGHTLEEKDRLVKPWAGFIEIHSSPMSFGSYSGAGFKEKITWDKFSPNAYGCQIFGDYTAHFPDIAAIMLGY